MSRYSKKSVKHLNPENVVFCLFTPEEVSKLSVLKICTPLTFDILGHPLSGGLYDKKLGPVSERSDPCGTCAKNIYSCPGHFGHIELPVNVVNPLFHNLIASILKRACFTCFQIQIPGHLQYMLSLQIKLLDHGFLAEANEIESRIAELTSKFDSFENIPEDEMVTIREYENILIGASKIPCNKNIMALREKFIGDIFAQLKPKKLCLFCKAHLVKISVLKNKILYSARITETDKDTSSIVAKQTTTKHLNPDESRKLVNNVWVNNKEFLFNYVPVLREVKMDSPTDIFYFDSILVPPSNVRPVNMINGVMSEHQQTLVYKTILQDSMLLRSIMQVVINNGNVDVLPIEAQATYKLEKGASPLEKFNNVWDRLQGDVNSVIDYESKLGSTSMQGLKQIIEKKQGIIRMHMMGKRVNFAARSVITPDPNLNIDEIGIPEEFAKHLTYPIPVTAWNVEELRKLIMNGPDVHPGAVSVEFENGTINRINPKDQTQQESLLKRLLTPDGPDKTFRGVKMVNRHLCNGDILLLNRQPTLHRPSIMAHTARILKGEKTLRLHYANCKAYNADFDGDEMNAHFPQNELARSEGYILANVSNHYLVPKDGTPLSGLIQDHMISGVRMTIRGKFFNKIDYQQLVYQALSHKLSHIKLLPPAILKPQELWSGKQVISTVILNVIPKGKHPINLTATSKIPSKAWQNYPAREWKAGGTTFSDPSTMTEAEVIIREGELLVGILDKTHYGATPYGLVHCMYELYGGTQAIKLLSSFAKLFTWFLQREGFTLGVKDILVLKDADKKRSKIVRASRRIGKKAITEALNIHAEAKEDDIVSKIQEETATNPKIRSIIDRRYKSALDSFTNDINKTCLPAGLICKFPENNLQLMVQSGAKGSTVNTMQISCLLGQIELEGKRPPVMISGKSLPSFPAHEFAPRAGGFIDGRFMTGIQPQEFFFHCMAGREGLIDTAVKTSRSGYLQRCLVKHLEGLKVGYDLTVRDSDMSVIQFNYGEDGMDISKAQFLNKKQFSFLAENCKALGDKKIIDELKASDDYSKMLEYEEVVNEWFDNRGTTIKYTKRTYPYTIFSSKVYDKIDLKNGDSMDECTGRSKRTKLISQLWKQSNDNIKESFKTLTSPCPDPVVSKFRPDYYFGAINERLTSLIDDYSEKIKKKKSKKLFSKMVKLKALQSLCAPGEPVGLLAAQSIGEPSTQMTLNTFHFAGRGEMNVTLGIPRLREILMMASKNIKTPSMEVPFLNVVNLEARAEKLRKQLTRVVVADILEKVDVTHKLELVSERQFKYEVRFQFIPHKLYKRDYYLKPKNVIKYMGEKFFQLMFASIKKYGKGQKNIINVENEKSYFNKKKSGVDDDEDLNENQNGNNGMALDEDSSDDEVPEDSEDAKANARYTVMHDDQEPEEEDGEENAEEEEDNNKGEEENEKKETQELTEKEVMLLCSNIVNRHEFASDFSFDSKNYSWCQIKFGIPLTLQKIDLSAILKEVAKKAVLWETPGIKRAITYMNNDKLTLRTDGINFLEMFKHHRLLDLDKLFSNDIHKVAETYGIEAARKVIVKEVQDVFKVYGITVDPRHLLLIADYMTFGGQFEPLNRTGMESSTSPFQQMTFEASLKFLKSAAIKGKEDKLENPSSCLMVGKPCTTGTGSFTLLQRLKI